MNFNIENLNEEGTKKGAGLKEETTEYPEFVPSFNSWTTSEAQQLRAKELENMTD